MQGWQHSNGLIVPATVVRYPIASLDASLMTYVTYTEVYGRPYTVEDLVHDLSQLSVEDCLQQLSGLLILLDNSAYLEKNMHLRMAQRFFDNDKFQAMKDRLDQEPNRLIFFEQQLLTLSKYTILYAKDEESNNFNNGKLYPVFANALLGVTDLLIQGQEIWGKKELQQEAIKNVYFGAKQDFRRSISRAHELFFRIRQQLTQHHQYVDLNATFEAATGLPLKDFTITGLSLLMLSIQQSPESITENGSSIDPAIHFAQARLKQQEIDLLFTEYATSTRKLQE